MRTLIAVLTLALVTPAVAGTRTSRTENVNGRETRLLNIIEDDGTRYATWENNDDRYRTEDPGVLAEVEEALRPQRELSRKHSDLGRKHSLLGREHSALGREHSKLGREHSRAARRSDADAEAIQRDLERQQRELEVKQRELERRQQDLERQQRELERTQKHHEHDIDAKMDEIFRRALKAGKARRF
jgi:septal ring factor EnvC (AmiA/AmiB activator)